MSIPEQTVEPHAQVRRVAALVDGSPGWRQRLGVAVGLCVRLGSELRGLYWLNSRLQQLAQSGQGRELDVLTGIQRTLEPAQLRRDVRVQAMRMRQAVTERGREANIPFSFQVLRGAGLHSVLEEQSPGDLLIFGRTQGGLGDPRTRGVAGTAIAVVFDQSERAMAMLAVAADLASLERRPLRVLTPGNRLGPLDAFRKQAAGWLRSRHIPAQFDRIDDAELDGVLAATTQQSPSLLVIDRERVLPVEIQRLERLRYPVALLH